MLQDVYHSTVLIVWVHDGDLQRRSLTITAGSPAADAWSEWVSIGLTSHSTHFADESFQAIICTDTDNHNFIQGNKTLHSAYTLNKKTQTEKICPSYQNQLQPATKRACAGLTQK